MTIHLPPLDKHTYPPFLSFSGWALLRKQTNEDIKEHAFSRRRHVVRAFMQGLDERYHRKQFIWDPVSKKFVEHEEVVPDECLSAELSDFLLNIAGGVEL